MYISQWQSVYIFQYKHMIKFINFITLIDRINFLGMTQDINHGKFLIYSVLSLKFKIELWE